MANLRDILGRVKHSRGHEKRFYSSADMAEIKRYEAVTRSQENRGEIPKRSNNEYISECRCGVAGCFIHGSMPTVTQEQKDQAYEKNVQYKKDEIDRINKLKSQQGKKSRANSKKTAILKVLRGW